RGHPSRAVPHELRRHGHGRPVRSGGFGRGGGRLQHLDTRVHGFGGHFGRVDAYRRAAAGRGPPRRNSGSGASGALPVRGPRAGGGRPRGRGASAGAGRHGVGGFGAAHRLWIFGGHRMGHRAGLRIHRAPQLHGRLGPDPSYHGDYHVVAAHQRISQLRPHFRRLGFSAARRRGRRVRHGSDVLAGHGGGL